MVAGGELELQPSQLARRCSPEELSFETTRELEDPAEPLGQWRALEALRLATQMRWPDYNVYVLGSSGMGKHAIVRPILEQYASRRPSPSAWVYVHDFHTPDRPKKLSVPPGQGLALREHMDRLLGELVSSITATLGGDELRAARERIEEEYKDAREAAFQALVKEAEQREIMVVRTPDGFGIAPRRGDGVLSRDEVQALPEAERSRVLGNLEAVEGLLKELMKQGPKWQREEQAKLRALFRETLRRIVEQPMTELRHRYADAPELVEWLEQAEKDILENAELFVSSKPPIPGASDRPESGELRRYRVNVMIDHASSEGAPVVYEPHPTHANLIGRIEHASVLGTLVTHHGLIKPGALHRANGGCLILDAVELFSQPFAWDALKRALRSEEIRIESPGQAMGLVSTETLEPDPIPLDLKVILLGPRRLYHLVSALDPTFGELFKVPVDLEELVDWTPANARGLAATAAGVARREGLLAFERDAAARLVEHSARRAHDAQKLSLNAQELRDLMRESDHHARAEGAERVQAEHVRAALDAQVRRSDQLRRYIYEQIRRRALRVEVTGRRVGQVNGLSVVGARGFVFGQPSRISARVGLGRGQIVDVEREVELGGPIHSKGVLILQGFILARFGAEAPLSLSATLTFEQSYGGVEGDSAAAAEACALISALAEVPLDQAIAVTGSIDQFGALQSVGGINEKVEGFFDVCRELGLTGEQGVVIPRSNVANLMLRDDVVRAVAERRFRVYAAESVDEVLALLTHIGAGVRDAEGRFPAGSINALAEGRLSRFAEAARRYAMPIERTAPRDRKGIAPDPVEPK